MPDSRVTIARDGSVAIVTLSRPDKLNALDLGMIEAIESAIAEIEGNRDVRAAIIAGEGKAFSAGGDIKAWSTLSPEQFGYDWVRYGHRAFARLAELRIPLIAALNGHALGGGLELAGCADIRIAEWQIRIGLPETGLGMVPGWSGTQRLVRRFGAQAVRRMVLGGEIFSAAEALSLDIVDQVVDTGKALDTALAYARRIVSRGPAAIQTAKLMIASAAGESDGSAIETIASILTARTGDLAEGVAAFGEKREPSFKGEW